MAVWTTKITELPVFDVSTESIPACSAAKPLAELKTDFQVYEMVKSYDPQFDQDVSIHHPGGTEMLVPLGLISEIGLARDHYSMFRDAKKPDVFMKFLRTIVLYSAGRDQLAIARQWFEQPPEGHLPDFAKVQEFIDRALELRETGTIQRSNMPELCWANTLIDQLAMQFGVSGEQLAHDIRTMSQREQSADPLKRVFYAHWHVVLHQARDVATRPPEEQRTFAEGEIGKLQSEAEAYFSVKMGRSNLSNADRVSAYEDLDLPSVENFVRYVRILGLRQEVYRAFKTFSADRTKASDFRTAAKALLQEAIRREPSEDELATFISKTRYQNDWGWAQDMLLHGKSTTMEFVNNIAPSEPMSLYGWFNSEAADILGGARLNVSHYRDVTSQLNKAR